jgi:hypothetical protein
MLASFWDNVVRLLGLLVLAVVMLILVMTPGTSLALDYEASLTTPPFDELFVDNPTWVDAVKLDEVTDRIAVRNDQWFLKQIIGIFFDADLDSEEQKATYYIKWVLNLALSFVGFVALVVLIFGFYQMFASGSNDEGWKKAQETVVRASIALAVIALSWFIVSWFFDIFVTVSEPLTQ